MMKFTPGGVEVLESTRHSRKLKRGALKANLFNLNLREMPGGDNVRARLQQRLEIVARDGVPNYFGEQRFGRDGKNLCHADRLLRGEISVQDRHKRGLYLSSARGYLFNLILSGRVAENSWKLGKTSLDSTSSDRTSSDKTWGPLYGTGTELEPREERILSDRAAWCRGLEQLKLKGARRSFALETVDLQWDLSHCGQLRLHFGLAPGCYATSVLRELVDFGVGESGLDEGDWEE
jgi:tRNA pseudouridine13 synthase